VAIFCLFFVWGFLSWFVGRVFSIII